MNITDTPKTAPDAATPGSTTPKPVTVRRVRTASTTRATGVAPRFQLTSCLPPLLVLVALIGLWYAVSYGILDEQQRFLLPPPHQVITQALLNWTADEHMLIALGRTARVAFVGLAIATVIGMAWAVAMSQARWLERSLFPYAVALQCIPILALVPLIGFWFDFGFVSRTIVCVLISLFPIVSNTLFGLQSVDKAQRDLFALHGASRWTTLRKLDAPAAMPAIFAGFRIAAGLSVIGAIVGDMFFKQGDPGLGILIDNYRARIQSPQLFLAIIVASLFGITVFASFGWLSARVVGRWYDTAKAS
jgi:NitT/TauT family transport system permease protein